MKKSYIVAILCMKTGFNSPSIYWKKHFCFQLSFEGTLLSLGIAVKLVLPSYQRDEVMDIPKSCSLCTYELAPRSPISHTKIHRFSSPLYKMEEQTGWNLRHDLKQLLCYIFSNFWHLVQKPTDLKSFYCDETCISHFSLTLSAWFQCSLLSLLGVTDGILQEILAL